MTRLAPTFAALKQKQQKAFIPFTMAGDPDAAATLQLLHGLVAHGADVLELGMPFSDPMADGPAIAAAGLRALKAGMTLHKCLQLVTDFRAQNSHTPIVLMGYANPVFQYGLDNFAKDAAIAGIDGLIIVDVPAEESATWHAALAAHHLALIPLVAPTTPQSRLPFLLKHATGFVYLISMTGITGSAQSHNQNLAEQCAALKAATDLPIAIGFGVSTPEQAQQTAQRADAVVVGSALVRLWAETINQGTEKALATTLALAKSLSNAVKTP